MNPKIPKLTEDIAKLKRKIANNQARLRDMERLKIELENADIIAAVRRIDVPPEELSAIIQKLQGQAVPNLDAEEGDQSFEKED